MFTAFLRKHDCYRPPDASRVLELDDRHVSSRSQHSFLGRRPNLNRSQIAFLLCAMVTIALWCNDARGQEFFAKGTIQVIIRGSPQEPAETNVMGFYAESSGRKQKVRIIDLKFEDR